MFGVPDSCFKIYIYTIKSEKQQSTTTNSAMRSRIRKNLKVKLNLSLASELNRFCHSGESYSCTG